MKKIIFMVAAFILMGATASAQFTTSGGGRGSMSTSSSVESKFGTFSVSYNPVKFNSIYDDETETLDAHGISAAWTDAYSVVPNVPVYFEWGIGAQWSFKNDSDSLSVTLFYKISKVFVCSETTVKFFVIRRLITMADGLEQRSDVKSVTADGFDMGNPRENTL